MDELLARFVVKTKSRASGCWRLENGFLNLVGFGWAADMPDEVSSGFQAATRHVPMTELGLGIVKAAAVGLPAIGRLDAASSGLQGSAGWIAKFAARSSLAVPIRAVESGAIMGVIAVSTAANVEEGDSLWRIIVQLASELGRSESTPEIRL